MVELKRGYPVKTSRGRLLLTDDAFMVSDRNGNEARAEGLIVRWDESRVHLGYSGLDDVPAGFQIPTSPKLLKAIAKLLVDAAKEYEPAKGEKTP